jgi:hypothetical protein
MDNRPGWNQLIRGMRHRGPPASLRSSTNTAHKRTLIARRRAELTRLQQEVFTTAAREASEIVSTARSEVRRVILQARRDLLMLAAQIDVIGNIATDGAAPAERAPRALSAARQDLRQVLHEASGEFQTVTEYSQALQAQTAQLQAAPVGEPPPEASTPSPQPDAWENVRARVGVDSADVGRSAGRTASARDARVRRRIRDRGSRDRCGQSVVDGSITRKRRRDAAATTQPAVSEARPTASAPPRAKPAPVATPSLSVEARRQAWIRLTQDGRVLFARLVKPGETFRINDAREVSIRSETLVAVVVSVNGGEAMPLGRDGEVLTRNFRIERAEPPTSTAATARSPRPTSQPSTRATPPSASLHVEPADIDARRALISGAAGSGPGSHRRVKEPPTVARPVPQPSRAPEAADGNERCGSCCRGTNAEHLRPTSLRVAERWLDAYYRQDRAAMATLSAPQLILSDERVPTERLPAGLSPVRREMQDVSVRVFGSDALYVARMTERLDNAPAAARSGAFVSQMWTMRDGAWRLTNVRIVGAATVSKSVR